MVKSKLPQEYPWLKVTTTPEKYIYPKYYNQLIKKYVFKNKNDLEYLRSFVKKNIIPSTKILEIGPGTGRATKLVLDFDKNIDLTLLDLSDRLLKFCKKQFRSKPIKYIKSDAIDYFLSSDEQFNFIYSLWSFSHSIHQNLHRLGMSKGKEKIRRGINNLLTKNLNVGGYFFLIHFDSLSEEQRISIRQRKKDNDVYRFDKQQSPSKQIIDKVLKELKKDGYVETKQKHLIGDPIHFKSLNEALEYYCNFHMESHFNKTKMINEVITDLTRNLKKHIKSDGTLSVKPGCFIYYIKRIK
jgi:SAM-dependent methyltransferase